MSISGPQHAVMPMYTAKLGIVRVLHLSASSSPPLIYQIHVLDYSYSIYK